MKRVMVVGGPGSGKSTLAVQLGEITGLPVFHMDHFHYQQGWIMRSRAEVIDLANEVEGKPKWIFEGGLSATYENRARRSDTLIWLDIPVTARLRRLVKRWQKYRGQTRPDMAEGCPERLTLEFLSFVVRTRNTAREKIAQTIAEAPHLRVHHIRTAKGVDTLLKWLRDDIQNNH